MSELQERIGDILEEDPRRSDTSIARELGCTQSHVSQTRRAAGRENGWLRNRRERVAAARRDAAARLTATPALTDVRLARELGVDRTLVQRVRLALEADGVIAAQAVRVRRDGRPGRYADRSSRGA